MSLLANSNAIETGGYQISRSVRLRSSASAYFNRTPSSGNTSLFTLSAWVKRGKLGVSQKLFGANNDTSGNYQFNVTFTSGDQLSLFNSEIYPSNYYALTTNQVFRDPSAWYHIVITVDTAQSTGANRVKMYVNGYQVTSWATQTIGSQNMSFQWNRSAVHGIGAYVASAGQDYADCYITECFHIDGQALTPSSFGQTDTITGVWVAKKYTGTYGTNGFYLNFSDNSAATSTTIGKDYSGNGNNWTPNNISVTAGSTYDSMLDVPSGNGYADGGNGRGNYCVLNPLANSGIGTLSNGNLTLVTSTNSKTISGTMALPSTGQYYFEITATDYVTDGGTFLGLVNNSFLTGAPSNGTWLGFNTYSGTYNNGTSTDTNNLTGTNVTQDGDIWCIAVDVTNGKFWIGRSRSGSLTWADGVTPAVNGSGATTLSLPSGTLYPMAYRGGSFNETYDFNFGQRSTGFAHTPPTGFKALNTTNLSDPTVKDGGDYFNTVLYTGDSSYPRSITGVGFQPDFTWVKSRSKDYSHVLYDAVRGTGTTKSLISDSTGAEGASSTLTNLSSFDSDGFTIGSTSGTNILNTNPYTFVAWNWKANGAGVTNTAGSITSTVSANTTSGFSIVTYTGTGANATVGHGLGVAPQMIIHKCRGTAATNWPVYHVGIGNTGVSYLNSTTGTSTSSAWLNNTSPTSTVWTIGTDGDINGSTRTYVAYCFAPVAGYSAFGKYTGNGSTDGPFVYCGFRPRFFMIKRTDTTTNWIMYDTARQPYNTTNPGPIYANLSSAEEANVTLTAFDVLSNGFKPRNTSSWAESNASGGTYIYAAFAEVPLKFSNAR